MCLLVIVIIAYSKEIHETKAKEAKEEFTLAKQNQQRPNLHHTL
jgi:hypothetical protein